MHAPEVVIYDAPHSCSYLPGRLAITPYRRQLQPLTPDEFDARLAEGDRRSGVFLYRTRCPTCQACQPIRIDVAKFLPRATQKRVLRRGNLELDVRIGPPAVDFERVRLFNLHRDVRSLGSDDLPIEEASYAEFLTETCCDTLEFSYWLAGRLVAVAIADAGKQSLSAVYCYYDPHLRGLSLGTYSVLRQIEWCRATGREFLYLGFFIAESPHMSYKASFRPHQRRVRGEWLDFQ